VHIVRFVLVVKRNNYPPFDAELGEQVSDGCTFVQVNRAPALGFGREFVTQYTV
jgi:hypothetical protein